MGIVQSPPRTILNYANYDEYNNHNITIILNFTITTVIYSLKKGNVKLPTETMTLSQPSCGKVGHMKVPLGSNEV